MGNFDPKTKNDEIREHGSSYAEKLLSVDEIQLNHILHHKVSKV